MANTLNLGNGNWATKEDSLLAYNSENGNFKPLPFDFTRASSATVVNKAGLIETVGSGEPRIDFSNNAKGALLLEPTRSNLFSYSEDFDNAAWTKSGASVVSGFVSPSGDTSAFKLVEDSISSSKSIKTSNFSVVNGQEYTISIFAKPNGRFLQITPSVAFVQSYINYDLNNGTMDLSGSGSASGTITLLSNGYYRCTYTAAANASSTIASIFSCLVNSISATRKPSYQGDGTSGVYIYGAQVEQGSYATSYIPTQGSAVTRVADTANGAGNATVINSTEGVLYAEISALTNDATSRRISISDGTNTNRIFLSYGTTSNNIRVYIVAGGVNVVDRYYIGATITNFNKIAIRWEVNNFSLWVNGLNVSEDLLGATFTSSVLNALSFNGATGGSPFYGNTKDIRVYNTALTDAELTTLTTI